MKWQPRYIPVMAICFVYVSLPTVLLMYFNILASCLVPNIILQFFIVDSLALALNSFGWLNHIVSQLVFSFVVGKFSIIVLLKHFAFLT